MLDINKTRNNYNTKYTSKCETRNAILVQQKKQQQQQLNKPQNTYNNANSTAVAKGFSTTTTLAASRRQTGTNNFINDLRPAISVKQIAVNPVVASRSSNVGVGRGVTIAARIDAVRRGPAAGTTTATTTTTTATTTTATTAATTTNPVRKANERFFLVADFQDKNFLKAECALAHAQVVGATSAASLSAPTTPPTCSPVKRATAGSARKTFSKDDVGVQKSNINNNNNSFNFNNNNNNNSISSSNNLNAYSKTTVTHVMRRSNNGVSSSFGYGNVAATKSKHGSTPAINIATTPAATAITTTTTTTNATTTYSSHKSIVNGVGSKSAPPTTSNSKSATATAAATTSNTTTTTAFGSSVKLSSTLNTKAVKPLVHRATTSSNRTNGYESPVNNNNDDSGTNNSPTNLSNLNLSQNNNNNNNNSMAASSAAATTTTASFEHDDIKYIDSDEVVSGSLAGSSGKFVNCLEPMPSALKTPTSTAQKLTTAAPPSNPSSSSRLRPKSTILCSSNHLNYKYTNGATEPTTTNSNANSRRALNIDSNSIKASIEKFNSFSEQKRLPLSNAVTLRAHASATGSQSNLQYHRHSGSDFDSRQLNNSSGGSLTRNTYRATAGFSTTASNSLLPLKAKVRVSDVAASTATTYKTASAIRQQQQANSSSAETIETNAIDESVRSAATTTKSVLPPASPTASRYWDRDNVRTSSLSTLSSSAHNSLDADKSSHDEKSEGLCGLRNIGNTCFMNSIIQCLSHTYELTKFLRNYSNGKSSSTSSSSSSTKDQLILQEFAKLIREMWTSSVHSVTPMDLKRAFSAKHRMYSDYNQQDAQEFLRFFLDSLHSALNSGVKGEPLRIDDNLSDNRKAELTWDWYTRYENSLIRDLFVGQLKSTLRCTACGNASVTFDPFWDLSVSLPSSSRCRLDACLDLFIREEVLDGDEMPTCSKCKTRRKCTKSFSIQRFPKYLVIHLKRFSETRWSKLSSIVEFPTGERELNMGSYGANPNSNIYYSLYAISNHMGSTAGGHYVALCKHPASRKWHEFNDNVVSDPLPESHLVTSSAYILFYERA